MPNLWSMAKKYWLALYWAAFTGFAAFAATVPGYIPRRLEPAYPYSYPWSDVIFMSALLLAAVGVLHIILRPTQYRRSRPRLIVALVYSVLLLTISVLTTGTDYPGLAYVPFVFSLVTFIGLATYAAAIGIGALTARHHAGA